MRSHIKTISYSLLPTKLSPILGIHSPNPRANEWPRWQTAIFMLGHNCYWIRGGWEAPPPPTSCPLNMLWKRQQEWPGAQPWPSLYSSPGNAPTGLTPRWRVAMVAGTERAWGFVGWGAYSREPIVGRWGGHRSQAPSPQHVLHCPDGLHLQNTNSKMKLLRIWRLQSQSIKPQAQGSSEHGPLCDCAGPRPWEELGS